MVDAGTWADRIGEWRRSGLTSEEFCRGKEFTAGGLRNWAHRLGKVKGRGKGREEVRLARVITTPARVALPLEVVRRERAGSGVVVAIGAARVEVGAGFDREALCAVLELLGARGGR